MDITYFGHSSFKLKGRTGTVVTDPFDPGMVGLKFSPVEAEIVTISHDHSDHNQAALVSGVKKIVSGPGEYEIMGISVIGLPSYHDEKEGSMRGKNTIYIYEIDGLRLAHLGDLGHKLSEEMIEDMGRIDILMIPVGGEFTIGPVEATALVQAIEPSVVIPMHYQAPGLKPETFSKLGGLEPFLKEVGLKVETLPKLSIKKEDLGEDQKVVVLEKK
jgi:L-ascorbate metabolism protein UlaG (beta-lactamase superfamily)